MDAGDAGIADRLSAIIQALRADGYDMDLRWDGGTLEASIVVAGPDACPDCLSPESVIRPMMDDLLAGPDGPGPPIRLRYPSGHQPMVSRRAEP
jgi:hypothetical protein